MNKFFMILGALMIGCAGEAGETAEVYPDSYVNQLDNSVNPIHDSTVTLVPVSVINFPVPENAIGFRVTANPVDDSNDVILQQNSETTMVDLRNMTENDSGEVMLKSETTYVVIANPDAEADTDITFRWLVVR